MRRWRFILVAMLLLSQTPLAAQMPGSVLRSLRPGATIRLTTVSGKRLTGAVRAVDATRGTLSLDVSDAPTIDVTQIDSLWTRGTSMRRGALIGGGVALVGGGLFWGEVCTVVAEGNGCDKWGTVALFTVGTGVAGALVGGAVGAVIPRWKSVFAVPALRAQLRPGPDGTMHVGLGLRF